MVKEINTYIFFDLEATGLPGPGSLPRITEISLVAVHSFCLRSRDTTGNGLPRVVNKLTQCVCPRKPIPGLVSSLTGLQNDHLERHKDFDPDLADSIIRFIERHEAPVCLVAHNGLRYDFPLLKAELNCVGKELPEGVLCADSLVMFKDIDEKYRSRSPTPVDSGYQSPVKAPDMRDPPPVKRKLFPEVEPPAPQRPPDEHVTSESAEPESKIMRTTRSGAKNSGCVGQQFWDELRRSQSLEDDLLSAIVIPGESQGDSLYHDPSDSQLLKAVNTCIIKTKPEQVSPITDVTDRKIDRSSPPLHNPAATTAPSPPNASETPQKTPIQNNSNSGTPTVKLSYKLVEVHQRIMGYKPMNAHSAEDDALAMARMFHRMPDVYCKWAEENALLFSEMEPMYKNNRRSPLPPGVFPYNCPVSRQVTPEKE